jgi:hypothetical protein
MSSTSVPVVRNRRPPPIIVNGRKEWLVDRITDHFPRSFSPLCAKYYQVYWVGYTKPTWEPFKNVSETEALENYIQSFSPVELLHHFAIPLAADPRH